MPPPEIPLAPRTDSVPCKGLISLVKPGAKLPVGVGHLHAEVFEQFPIHTSLRFPTDEVISQQTGSCWRQPTVLAFESLLHLSGTPHLLVVVG